MKIAKSKLKRIIEEEIKTLPEGWIETAAQDVKDWWDPPPASPNPNSPEGRRRYQVWKAEQDQQRYENELEKARQDQLNRERQREITRMRYEPAASPVQDIEAAEEEEEEEEERRRSQLGADEPDPRFQGLELDESNTLIERVKNMKITKTKLKRIIREELQKINELECPPGPPMIGGSSCQQLKGGAVLVSGPPSPDQRSGIRLDPAMEASIEQAAAAIASGNPHISVEKVQATIEAHLKELLKTDHLTKGENPTTAQVSKSDYGAAEAARKIFDGLEGGVEIANYGTQNKCCGTNVRCMPGPNDDCWEDRQALQAGTMSREEYAQKWG